MPGTQDSPWDNPIDQGKGMNSWDRNMQRQRRQSMGQSHGSREEDE